MLGIRQPFDDFKRDGVVLLRKMIRKETMAHVVRQYERLNGLSLAGDAPKDEPLVVLWRHVPGAQKRIVTFANLPMLWDLILYRIAPFVRRFPGVQQLQLLETIVFDKPPKISNTLHWHQDVAYFPLQPNNQLAVWIPFEPVTEASGAMQYALGTHLLGIRGSTNLHTREPFAGEDRPLIPEDPRADGYDVRCFEMEPTDMLVHDGFIWHTSGPNTTEHQRRGLSVRFITEPAVFDPRPGQGAAFTKQITCGPGEPITGPAFPLL